jgi:hypothetical protein
MIETLVQSGPEADKAHVQNTSFEVEGAFGRDRTKTDPNAVLGAHLSRARAQAEDTQDQVDSYNAAAAERNARIQETLKIATGMSLGSDPEDYWKAWSAENEMHYGEEEPVYETYDEYTHSYVYEQAPRYPVSTGAPRAAGTVTATSSPTQSTVIPGVECFAPGTPVWTQAGPTPIEQIRVGDMVLAQNPTTGELAYRPVLETTVGDPVPVLTMSFAGEKITATRGHRFWVNGHGWKMAKELKPAASLHALEQSMDMTAIEKAEDISCYNLIVDEFHTFFVGKSRLLVHDKGCPLPTTAIIPGRTLENAASSSPAAY